MKELNRQVKVEKASRELLIKVLWRRCGTRGKFTSSPSALLIFTCRQPKAVRKVFDAGTHRANRRSLSWK